MPTIKELGQLYSTYHIYPKSKFNEDSPVRLFQQLYPLDHYTSQITDFLSTHDYPSDRRGADLPWWGKRFFTKDKGIRVFVVSQDSLSDDAGSIVFFTHLMNNIIHKSDYEAFCRGLNVNQRFRYASFNRIRAQIHEWGLDFDYLFITDAAKVYKQDSWQCFDRSLSKRLLIQEIEFCNPDLIILLGSAPLKLLREDLNYGDTIEMGKLIEVRGKKTIVTPFPSGNGLSQTNYNQRMTNATNLILNTVND